PFDTPEQALILASIVEKETGIGAERPRVAAVFINRLRKKMRLQSDPTVTYGITLGEHPLGRALTRRDLETDTPYNTYRIAALPPGPICNPGKDAIAAVLNPLVSDEFYFVADGTGGHVFAKTLAEHNRNVARWRRLQKKKKR
ncbi:MAG: endolytic transglycosylase MltG, partial [Alphaproteobacteria bacterium]|nr:endolytic transglycosylase MltG [Alphaproteobacteria bacterium]